MMPDFGPPPARARYVPNDIGPSPENWLAPRIEQVSTLITNGFVGTATPFYTDHTGVKYLYGQNVRQNYVDEAGIRYITKSFHDDQSKTRLRTGDILTVQSGHIGVTAVVPPSLDGANCHALIVTRLRKQYANPDFVSQYLNSEIGKARLRGLEVGSTILHINTKDLKKFRIPLPALAEQERIVDFLKTWDRAIETVEALIANARAQKQALMQQLLPQGTTPPKKRLPGFSGEWREVRLGNLVKEVNRDVDWDDEATYKLISVRRRSEGIFHRESLLGHEILTKAMKVALAGDFLISKMQIVHGASALVKADFDGFNISGSYIALVPKDQAKLDIGYFDWYSRTPYFYKLAYISSYGVHIEKMTFNLKSFLKQTILMPPSKAEQAAIVEQLNSAEALIGSYQSQADALRQEKAALMQQLLTGKRRVKLPENSAQESDAA